MKKLKIDYKHQYEELFMDTKKGKEENSALANIVDAERLAKVNRESTTENAGTETLREKSSYKSIYVFLSEV